MAEPAPSELASANRENPRRTAYDGKMLESAPQNAEDAAGEWTDEKGAGKMSKRYIDADSMRPVAHWDMEEDAVGDPIVWTCSNCKDSIIMYDGTPMENGYKYCPMCGARMEDATND